MKSINRIFLFGDSFVEGQGTYESIDKTTGNFFEPDGLHMEQLSQWRKDNSWNKIIKDRTGCSVINNGRQGSDNYSQYNHLNSIINSLTPNDLVIFGFTSKLRDSGFAVSYAFTQDNSHNSFLDRDNPLGKQIAWEKNLLEIDRYCTELDGHAGYKTDFEREFTKEYVEDFFTTIYNPQMYETIAQSNYLFYQNWFKKKGLNICFFDIFEKYIDEDFVQDGFGIDKDVYISYKSKSLTDVLTEYEIKNVKEDEVGVWEWGHKRPDLTGKIYHANQFGYKIFIDYLFENFLNKQYDFSANLI